MPVAIPLAAAAAGAAVASSTVVAAALGGAFGAAIAGGVLASAINMLGGAALAKKPKSQQFTQEASGRTLSIRSSVESHKVIYGTAKVSGPLVFAQTTDTGINTNSSGPNKFLHLVIPLAGHEVEAVTAVYFNDQPVQLDAGGMAVSAPYGRSTTETVTSSTGSTLTLTAIVRTRSSTLTATTLSPHGLSAGNQVRIYGVGGAAAYDMNGSFVVTSTPTADTFTVTSYGVDGYGFVTGAGAATTATTTTTVTALDSYARVKVFLGSPDQAASGELMAEIPGWTDSHRLRGIAYVHVRLEYSPDVFPLGIPNVSCVVKGKKVYDPRTGVTAWSANAALCVRDYLAADYGFDCAADEINDAYTIAAANVCDEAVFFSAGGSDRRYSCDGVLDTAVAPLDNLQALVTSLAGTVTYVQGRFRVHAAAYDTPAGSISTAMGADILAGDMQVDWRASRKELFNGVKGTFVDPGKSWQPTDFPPVTNATYRAEDNGELIFKDIELPFTIHAESAQRIAKIILEKGRQGIRVTLPVTHAALKYAAWDVVTLSDAGLGWTDKPFRVTRWNLATPGPITLSLQEESSASYDWNSGEATLIDPAPDTNLPDVFTVQGPGALTVSEALYVTRLGDGVKVRAALAWQPSGDAFLRDYQVEYKPAASGTWTKLARTASTALDVEDLEPGLYDFRVKAFSALGVSSPFSTATAQITGLLAPPTEPQNLTISTIGGLAVLRWDISPDLDVRIGGKITFRHSPAPADGWTASTSIGNAVGGGTTVTVLPLKPGIYLAKAVDSSGIESAVAAGVTTEQATALAFANVTSLTEHPTFSGAKTGCAASGGVLKLVGAGLFDAIPDLDAASSLDAYGGLVSAGTYSFSGGIDLGSVMPIRLTSHLKATIDNELDRLDERAAVVDDWTNFDGTEDASADAVVYVRATNDNPAGTPVWGEWQRLDSGEFNRRAFQFLCELETRDPAYNILISELSITADEVL